MNENIDEENIEEIIPNYANLSEEEQNKCLERIYKKQFYYKEVSRDLAELLEKQRKNKNLE